MRIPFMPVSTLRVLTYNVQMLPGMLSLSSPTIYIATKGKSSRANSKTVSMAEPPKSKDEK